jgi:hypothetical protein
MRVSLAPVSVPVYPAALAPKMLAACCGFQDARRYGAFPDLAIPTKAA